MSRAKFRPKAREVQLALARVRDMADLDSPECAVSQEAKDAARLYIHSWVLPLLDDLLEWSLGEREAKNLLSDREKYVASLDLKKWLAARAAEGEK